MPTYREHTTPSGQIIQETVYGARECAQEVRAILARTFPKVRFSVRFDRRNNLDVRWMDGPTIAEVQPTIDHCSGIEYVPALDTTRTRRDILPDGSRRINYLQYITCHREYSFRAYEAAAQAAAARYHLPVCPIAKPADRAPYALWDSALLGNEPQVNGAPLSLLVWREVANTAWYW